MKLTTVASFTLLFTILAGSTLYLVNQSKEDLSGLPTSGCGLIREDWPVATQQNTNPQRTLSIYNNCYKTVYTFNVVYEDLNDDKQKEINTPCLKNNEQFILPMDQPGQVRYVYQTYCKK